MFKHKGVLIVVVLFIAALYSTFRLLNYPAGLFCTAFLGGVVLWLSTTYQVPVDPTKLIWWYLLTVLLFIAHVFEEFVTHVEFVMSSLTGLHVTQKDSVTIAAFVAPIIWLTGALLMLRRWQFGFFLASVFYFGMMFGELTHFAFPFMETSSFHYVAGMYTAILPSAAAWCSFVMVIREMKRSRVSASARGND